MPQWSETEERGLHAAAVDGDETAWRRLYDRHFDALYRYVYYRVGMAQQPAEEVVQDTWMIAVRRIRRFDARRGSFEHWLRGIAHKVMANRNRRFWRRTRSRPTVEIEYGTHNGFARNYDVVDQVRYVLTGLPQTYREVLEAKYREGLSVDEIAARWDRSAKAVESLLSRARAAFRERFAEVNKEGEQEKETD